MDETPSERRLAENEVFFRQANERTEKGLQALKKLAKSEGQEDLLPDLDKPILFYCECADENCRERIKLRPSLYRRLHKDADEFVVIPGHVVPEIEREIKRTNTYVVVQKFMATPSKADSLNPTDIDHS